MGAMKRLVGWNQSGWPIPQPLQALGGLVPFRPDAEELADRRKAAAEAKAEREAIQAEAREAEAEAPKPALPEIVEDFEPDAALGRALPTAAAPGWYRLGQTFYRVDSGPFAGWGIPAPTRPPSPAPEPVRYVQTTMF